MRTEKNVAHCMQSEYPIKPSVHHYHTYAKLDDRRFVFYFFRGTFGMLIFFIVKIYGLFSFLITTRGDFQYISPDFIIDCHKEKVLKDPSKYIYPVNRKVYVKNRQCNLTRFMMRQRSLELPAARRNTDVLATSALTSSAGNYCLASYQRV